MNEKLAHVSRALELRHAFDQTFAEPSGSAILETENLLLIRLGGERYAVKTRNIGGLVRCAKVLPIASLTPGFIGVTGIRKVPVPVFSLAILLGHPEPGSEPRFLLVCGLRESVAFAFSDLEGHIPTARARLISVLEGKDSGGRHVTELVDFGTQVRPVINVESLLETAKRRAEASVPTGGK